MIGGFTGGSYHFQDWRSGQNGFGESLGSLTVVERSERLDELIVVGGPHRGSIDDRANCIGQLSDILNPWSRSRSLEGNKGGCSVKESIQVRNEEDHWLSGHTV